MTIDAVADISVSTDRERVLGPPFTPTRDYASKGVPAARQCCWMLEESFSTLGRGWGHWGGE